MEHVVGIGGYAVSGSPDDVIKTFALSTCVGLVYYSMRKRAMAMAHIQLPVCRSMSAGDKPSRFADLAAEFLLKEMQQKHGITPREVLISLYGGIDGRGAGDCFRIGEKNLQTVKDALRKLGLPYNEVDTGGQESRTLVAYTSTGIVEVIKRPMAFSGLGAAPRPGPQGPAGAAARTGPLGPAARTGPQGPAGRGLGFLR
ncbi:MAG: chemotaxis protein CheD [Oscillospiraceae bacterium]|nr:chemotaxis protein CheD [Oscillospiraceae bacterium]